MVYRAVGLMSGSSLDGLDIVFTELTESAGKWSFEIPATHCYPYSPEWRERLQSATELRARNYQLLHAEYGHFLGQSVNRFVEENGLHYKVALIASHGHTTFHLPARGMTAQLGDGAAIAAQTGLPVVSDLRSLDIAFGGQGAPIVPIGEKLLFPEYRLFLNLGGIANISFNTTTDYVAYDVCPANRVLNMIAGAAGKEYDIGGEMAAAGSIHYGLLEKLNSQAFYQQPFPKSLANEYGTETIYPLIKSFSLSPEDSLRTYVEHIVCQVDKACRSHEDKLENEKMLVTGGGGFNTFLVQRLAETLQSLNIEVVVPNEQIVQYKEALIMALIGVLRWRQEYNVLSSVTGARRNSIGGALWIGQEA